MEERFSMYIPAPIAFAIERLDRAGYEGWLVGGCVRDAVMGIAPHDYDITTSASPEETMAVFSDLRTIETGLKHGTVTVIIDGEQVEITTFRVEGEYLDNRHPSSVSFTRSVEEDLKRRDFTVNAMAYHPEKGLLDLFGGCDDIRGKVIACVGSAEERFNEDGLRILRALRFASRLGFSLDDDTDLAVRRLSGLLRGISAERIYSELCGILMGDNAGGIILRYAETLATVIPELKEIIGFAQNSRYHCYDVLEHTCRAIDAAPKERLVRLALLLHDIGKPRARSTGKDGFDHYICHEKHSAEMADDILVRLRADGHTRRTVVKLIAGHSLNIIPDERHAKRLLREYSFEEARLLLEVKKADRIAHAPGYDDPEDICAMLEIVDRLETGGACFSLDSLAVGGRDMISLGMKPGKAVGEVLNRLLDMVINGEVPNDREPLMKRAEKMIARITNGE